jgi:hypothetical protein
MEERPMNIAIFFLLSSITGVLEVGAVIYAILQDFSVVQVLLLVLAYQLGCFFPTNVAVRKVCLIALGLSSVVLALMLSLFPSFWLMMLSILFVSPCLQTARSLQKSTASTGAKRLFRIIGFGLAPLFSPLLLLAISITTLVIVIIQKNDNKNRLQFSALNSDYAIMVVHQMHYFSYAYIVLIIASNLDNFHGFLTALIFVLGWITYTSTQYILRKKKNYTYLICGHLLLFALISGIAIVSSETIKVILWILTGFGGGTVFCIKEILKSKQSYDNHTLESSENYGHILGVLCSIILFSIFGTLNAPIYFAAICAASTALLAAFLNKNQVKEVYIND